MSSSYTNQSFQSNTLPNIAGKSSSLSSNMSNDVVFASSSPISSPPSISPTHSINTTIQYKDNENNNHSNNSNYNELSLLTLSQLNSAPSSPIKLASKSDRSDKVVTSSSIPYNNITYTNNDNSYYNNNNNNHDAKNKSFSLSRTILPPTKDDDGRIKYPSESIKSLPSSSSKDIPLISSEKANTLVTYAQRIPPSLESSFGGKIEYPIVPYSKGGKSMPSSLEFYGLFTTHTNIAKWKLKQMEKQNNKFSEQLMKERYIIAMEHWLHKEYIRCFRGWKSVILQRKAKMNHVIDNKITRILHLFYSHWRSIYLSNNYSRHQSASALEHWAVYQQRKALLCWYFRIKKLNGIMNIMIKRRSKRILYRWINAMNNVNKLKYFSSIISSNHNALLVKDSFSMWKYLYNMKYKQLKLHTINDKYIICATFEQWKTAYQNSIKQKADISQAALKSVMLQWKEYTLYEKKQRRMILLSYAYRANKLFNKWKLAVKLKRYLYAGDKYHTIRLLQDSLSSWLYSLREHVLHRSDIVKAAEYCYIKSLKSTIANWYVYSRKKAHYTKYVISLKALWKHRTLSMIFYDWHKKALENERFRKNYEKSIIHYNYHWINIIFKYWKKVLTPNNNNQIINQSDHQVPEQSFSVSQPLTINDLTIPHNTTIKPSILIKHPSANKKYQSSLPYHKSSSSPQSFQPSSSLPSFHHSQPIEVMSDISTESNIYSSNTYMVGRLADKVQRAFSFQYIFMQRTCFSKWMRYVRSIRSSNAALQKLSKSIILHSYISAWKWAAKKSKKINKIIKPQLIQLHSQYVYRNVLKVWLLHLSEQLLAKHHYDRNFEIGFAKYFNAWLLLLRKRKILKQCLKRNRITFLNSAFKNWKQKCAKALKILPVKNMLTQRYWFKRWKREVYLLEGLRNHVNKWKIIREKRIKSQVFMAIKKLNHSFIEKAPAVKTFTIKRLVNKWIWFTVTSDRLRNQQNSVYELHVNYVCKRVINIWQARLKQIKFIKRIDLRNALRLFYVKCQEVGYNDNLLSSSSNFYTNHRIRSMFIRWLGYAQHKNDHKKQIKWAELYFNRTLLVEGYYTWKNVIERNNGKAELFLIEKQQSTISSLFIHWYYLFFNRQKFRKSLSNIYHLSKYSYHSAAIGIWRNYVDIMRYKRKLNEHYNYLLSPALNANNKKISRIFYHWYNTYKFRIKVRPSLTRVHNLLETSQERYVLYHWYEWMRNRKWCKSKEFFNKQLLPLASNNYLKRLTKRFFSIWYIESLRYAYLYQKYSDISSKRAYSAVYKCFTRWKMIKSAVDENKRLISFKILSRFFYHKEHKKSLRILTERVKRREYELIFLAWKSRLRYVNSVNVRARKYYNAVTGRNILINCYNIWYNSYLIVPRVRLLQHKQGLRLKHEYVDYWKWRLACRNQKAHMHTLFKHAMDDNRMMKAEEMFAIEADNIDSDPHQVHHSSIKPSSSISAIHISSQIKDDELASSLEIHAGYEMPSKLSKIIKMWRSYPLHVFFQHWKLISKELKQAKILTSTAHNHYTRNTFIHALNIWFSNIKHQKLIKSLLQQHVNNQLHNVIMLLKYHSEQSLTMKSTILHSNKLLAKDTFSSWLYTYHLHRTHKIGNQIAFKFWSKTSTRLLFNNWRVLTGRYVAVKSKGNEYYYYIANKIKKQAFLSWYYSYRQSIKERKQIAMSDNHYITSLLKHVYIHWYNAAQLNKQNYLTAYHHHQRLSLINLLYPCFNYWYISAIRQRELREKISTFLYHQELSSLVNVFILWRNWSVKHKNDRNLLNNFVILRRQRMIFNIWKEAYECITYDKIINSHAIYLRSKFLSNRLLYAISTWYKKVEYNKFIKYQVNQLINFRQYGHVKYIFDYWRYNYSIRVKSSHFSTTHLLSDAFSTWKYSFFILHETNRRMKNIQLRTNHGILRSHITSWFKYVKKLKKLRNLCKYLIANRQSRPIYSDIPLIIYVPTPSLLINFPESMSVVSEEERNIKLNYALQNYSNNISYADYAKFKLHANNLHIYNPNLKLMKSSLFLSIYDSSLYADNIISIPMKYSFIRQEITSKQNYSDENSYLVKLSLPVDNHAYYDDNEGSTLLVYQSNRQLLYSYLSFWFTSYKMILISKHMYKRMNIIRVIKHFKYLNSLRKLSNSNKSISLNHYNHHLLKLGFNYLTSSIHNRRIDDALANMHYNTYSTRLYVKYAKTAITHWLKVANQEKAINLLMRKRDAEVRHITVIVWKWKAARYRGIRDRFKLIQANNALNYIKSSFDKWKNSLIMSRGIASICELIEMKNNRLALNIWVEFTLNRRIQKLNVYKRLNILSSYVSIWLYETRENKKLKALTANYQRKHNKKLLSKYINNWFILSSRNHNIIKRQKKFYYNYYVTFGKNAINTWRKYATKINLYKQNYNYINNGRIKSILKTIMNIWHKSCIIEKQINVKLSKYLHVKLLNDASYYVSIWKYKTQLTAYDERRQAKGIVRGNNSNKKRALTLWYMNSEAMRIRRLKHQNIVNYFTNKRLYLFFKPWLNAMQFNVIRNRHYFYLLKSSFINWRSIHVVSNYNISYIKRSAIHKWLVIANKRRNFRIKIYIKFMKHVMMEWLSVVKPAKQQENMRVLADKLRSAHKLRRLAHCFNHWHTLAKYSNININTHKTRFSTIKELKKLLANDSDVPLLMAPTSSNNINSHIFPTINTNNSYKYTNSRKLSMNNKENEHHNRNFSVDQYWNSNDYPAPNRSILYYSSPPKQLYTSTNNTANTYNIRKNQSIHNIPPPFTPSKFNNDEELNVQLGIASPSNNK